MTHETMQTARVRDSPRFAFCFDCRLNGRYALVMQMGNHYNIRIFGDQVRLQIMHLRAAMHD